MSRYTRTLTFRTNNLGTDATFVLIFDKPSDGLYNNKFPVVWKVARFGSTGPYHITTTFSSRLAWCKPQIDNAVDSVVDTSPYTLINYNQKTTLQQDGSGVLSFTPPETGTPDSVTVVNGTQLRQDVALGFLPPEAFAPVTVNVWKGLGYLISFSSERESTNLQTYRASESIQTNFQPVLRAYITSQYNEAQIVRGEIATPIIFEQNLAALDDITVWDLRFNAASGRFSMTRA
ncbi:hypothetical protein JVT61DRAFT_8604 [Boletus reticuloceps]|uniref:Uncharacterized protein n=1 Tax=Boletus reticuloceps TaxID=495285 RepID=A0A8I3ACL4_9AGAM|nr:hypothetical protein JVT61DRAFT_8604 [Boletus reticuloceps]